MRFIEAADLFCGAGGTSSGLYQAAEDLGVGVKLLAVNHWPVAIATHSANHAEALHLCESLDNVNPRKVVPSGRLDLLVASPECTHHSNARGGRPMSDQSRASAWHILRWAEALRIDNIIVENVPEFTTWGPLTAAGRPDKRKRGAMFQAFIMGLKAMAYDVEWRILNAADYGDPTTRRRLFVIARRGRRRVAWPEPTHTPDGAADIHGHRPRWRAAREIIDWGLPSASVFGRKRPLAPNTMRRIAAGIQRFCGAQAEPFLVLLYGTSTVRSIDRPAPTVTGSPQGHLGLCEPFIMSAGGPKVEARPVSKPMNTVLTRDHMALVEPMLLPQQSKGICRPVSSPVPTVCGKGAVGLIEPFLVPFHSERDGQPARLHSCDRPLPAQVCSNSFGLAQPCIVPLNHGKGDTRSHDVNQPMPTVTSVDAWGLVEPVLVNFNGTGHAHSVNKPLPTVSTKDRFGLVEFGGKKYRLDIRFRMLQPRELARAQGFSDDYRFSGTREQVVKQIGNAVPVNLAKALCKKILGGDHVHTT